MKLSGRIIDAKTSAPLGDVVVTATGPGPGDEQCQVTFPDGAFTFEVKGGDTKLGLEREGYKPFVQLVHPPVDRTIGMEPVGATDPTVFVTSSEPIQPAEPLPIARARIAYFAYGRTTGGLGFQGGTMPAFDELPNTIRQAWINAAEAVRMASQPGGQLAPKESEG